jgi:hypothetical protein
MKALHFGSASRENSIDQPILPDKGSPIKYKRE